MDGYRPTTGDHADNLATALDRFEQALTRRWREEMCGRLSLGMDDYPRSIRASAKSASPAWDYTRYPNWLHIQVGNCAYVDWALSGQVSDLSAVSCPGYTGASADMWTDPDTGELGYVPAQIECGMDRVLLQVADWAYAERQHVSEQLPLFTSHDMAALRAAHDTFVELGMRLGQEPAADPASGTPFRPVSDREIGSDVAWLAGDREGADWWVGWTGLAASRARSGFFASVTPTLNNQSRILAALANLYAERVAIIEKGRNDTLYWLAWATRSLDDTVMVEDRAGWLALQGLGMGVSTALGWSGAGAVVGAAISLFGFLGEHLAGTTREQFMHDMVALVGRLNDEIGDLNSGIGGKEIGYSANVTALRETIHEVHSYNLELYDLTRNDPDGDVTCRDTAFDADIGTILGVSQRCYELAEAYAALLPTLADTAIADRHLADKDGRPTLADRKLLEVRDLLTDLLQTTTARYLVAGRQVQDAAEGYVETDFANAEDIETFNRTIADWEKARFGPPEVGFDPEAHAAATERPAGWAAVREDGSAGPPPGAGDGEEYSVEGESDEE